MLKALNQQSHYSLSKKVENLEHRNDKGAYEKTLKILHLLLIHQKQAQVQYKMDYQSTPTKKMRIKQQKG